MIDFLDFFTFQPLVIVSTLLTTLYVYFTWNFNHWSRLNAPYEPPIPFFGNLIDMFLVRKGIPETFKDIYLKHKGRDYVGIWLFRRPALIIRSPEYIKLVLVKDFEVFRDRTGYSKPDIDPLGSNNLFLIKGAKWRALRSRLTRLFTNSKLRVMSATLRDISQHNMVARIEREHIAKNAAVNLKELASLFTIDVIAATVFGINAGALDNPNSKFRQLSRKMFDFTWWRAIEIGSIFFAPTLAWIFRFKFFSTETSKTLGASLWKAINQREQESAGVAAKHKDMIDTLVELKNEKEIDGIKLTGDMLVAQPMIFLAAGFETTSSAISFTLYELAFNEVAQDRLYEEISAFCGKDGETFPYEDLNSLVYLDMCIKETYRKYPSAPYSFLDREATQKYTFPDGLVIEKGTPVFITQMGLNYDETINPNPKLWDPERFSPDRAEYISRSFTYLPFGGGPRHCIGSALGSMQVKVAVVELLRRYRIGPCPGTVPPARLQFNPLAFTIETTKPLLVTFSSRI